MVGNKTEKELLEFLRLHNVAALATVKRDNTAHVTTIYYYVDDTCNFYFLTKDETAKSYNLKTNHSVALVVSDNDLLQTVQVEGKAEVVDYGGAYSQTVKAFVDDLSKRGENWESIPLTHLKHGYFVFVKITPSWIRWTNFKDWGNLVEFEREFTTDKM